MCARPDPRRDLKVVTADDARQRMQQDRLATVIAFRVQGLLHAQGAEVAAFAHYAAIAISGKTEL